MAKKKPASPEKHTTDQILKAIRDVKQRSLETVRKMKELEKAVAASAKRK